MTLYLSWTVCMFSIPSNQNGKVRKSNVSTDMFSLYYCFINFPFILFKYSISIYMFKALSMMVQSTQISEIVKPSPK